MNKISDYILFAVAAFVFGVLFTLGAVRAIEIESDWSQSRLENIYGIGGKK